MKTTNNKHIINDKLQGVDLPDMDASWQKMEQTIEAGGAVQGGWSAFIAKYKIYLNLFVAITTIGLVGLLVKSKTLKSGLNKQETPSYTGETAYDLNYMTFEVDLNYDNDLPIPSMPKYAKVEPQSWNLDHIIGLRPVESTVDTSAENSNLPPTPQTVEDSIPEEEVMTVTTIGDLSHLKQHFTKPKVYVHNQVGFKLQSGLLPDVSLQNAMQSTGFAVFARRFVTPKSAVHLEIGYNPIIIRPITYVEKYDVFKNVNYTQTDSAVVTRLKYVTIPINWYYQIRPSLSFTIGPQISFLTGVSGDLTRKLSYPTAPESESEIKNISVKNRGGFNARDIGLNLGFSGHKGRYEFGFQIQTSFGDYTNETLSVQKHRFSTLQLKAACLLSK